MVGLAASAAGHGSWVESFSAGTSAMSVSPCSATDVPALTRADPACDLGSGQHHHRDHEPRVQLPQGGMAPGPVLPGCDLALRRRWVPGLGPEPSILALRRYLRSVYLVDPLHQPSRHGRYLVRPSVKDSKLCSSDSHGSTFITGRYFNESGWQSKPYVYLLGWAYTTIASGADASAQ